MNLVPPPPAQPGHPRRHIFIKGDEDVNENRPQHDHEDNDNRALDELVTWLGSLAGHNVVDIGDAEDKEPAENETNPGETTQPVDGKSQKNRPRRGKKPFQREYNRISQRERRQEKRKQKRREKQVEKGVEVDDEDTGDFPLLWVIYLAHDRNGQLRKEFPKSIQQSIEGTKGKETVEEYMRNYDNREGLEFSSPKELEDYLVIKRGELIGLRRRLMVISKTEKFYEDRLRAVDAKLEGLEKKSPEWFRTMNQERFQVVHRLAVVRHAAAVLPVLLERAGYRFQEAASEANEGHEMRMLFEKAESLREQLGDEKKKVVLLEKWIKHVVPMSETYNEMLGKLDEAENRKNELDEQLKKVEGDWEAAILAMETG